MSTAGPAAQPPALPGPPAPPGPPASPDRASGGDRPARRSVAALLADRREDDRVGLLVAEGKWSWRQVVEEAARRGAAARVWRRPGPFHVGVLLPNVPEYHFWLTGAALTGAAVVGINPTRRGEALASDIRSTDCQLLITDHQGADVLAGLDHGVEAARVIDVEDAEYEERLVAVADAAVMEDLACGQGAAPEDLYLLLFTSGTTGTPKAVRCTQRRLAAIAEQASSGYGYRPEDVSYCPMPLFHGNALMALWGPVLRIGGTLALPPRFSASAFLDDVRRFQATTFSYVGKAVAYILATPERPDDAENSLRWGFGTEASLRDRREFKRRFGCPLIEGYGQSEGGSSINVVPGTPRGALGKPPPGTELAVVDPDTGQECPAAAFDEAGALANGDVAIGEIVNRGGTGAFEGYYRNAEAEAARTRNGWYWTGDLGYRDAEGFFYYAGRGGDWLRVDSENFAAGPVESVLARHPDVAVVAVYPVPDTATAGDQVMAALELRPGVVTELADFDVTGFSVWMRSQGDLGTKWAPRYLRLTTSLPQTATGKVTKVGLRRQAWVCDDPVWWRPDPRDADYRRLGDADRQRLAAELAAHHRTGVPR